jgi:heptosyltransferase I
LFANSAPENICVLRLSAIGDTCHALAVIRNLQDNWPDARITWVIGKTEATLMGDIRDIEFITFDKAQGLAAYRHVGRQLAGRRFDVALCMHASMRANLLCRKIPAAVRVGFDKARARDFQWLFTNERIPAARGEHALEAMLGFARHIGARPTDLRWDIPIGESERAFAAQHAGPKTVVISPLSSQRSRNFRNWPADRFVAVARYLKDGHGHQSELEARERIYAYLDELRTTQRYPIYRALKHPLYPILRKIDRHVERIESVQTATADRRVTPCV